MPEQRAMALTGVAVETEEALEWTHHPASTSELMPESSFQRDPDRHPPCPESTLPRQERVLRERHAHLSPGGPGAEECGAGGSCGAWRAIRARERAPGGAAWSVAAGSCAGSIVAVNEGARPDDQNEPVSHTVRG